MRAIMLIVSAMVLTACQTAPLSPEEASVRILRKSDPDKNCKEIGKVHSPGLGAFSEQGRDDNLKRATFKAGGDTVTVDKTDENNTMYGTAYKCG